MLDERDQQLIDGAAELGDLIALQIQLDMERLRSDPNNAKADLWRRQLEFGLRKLKQRYPRK